MAAKVALVALLLTGTVVSSLNEYKTGDKVDVYVNKVGPYHNIHETYHYYTLPLCRPQKIVHKSLSLGQVLEGDRMAESAFELTFGSNSTSRSLCGPVTLDALSTGLLMSSIEEDYVFEMIIDDMRTKEFVGFVEEASVFPHEHKVFVYSHYAFRVTSNDKQVLDIKLEMSKPIELIVGRPAVLDFTYSVIWNVTSLDSSFRNREGNSKFSERTMHIHWLSVFNSALLVTVLVGLVIVIVISSVRRDLVRYNDADADDDLFMDQGWKAVAMDVFRPPKYAMLLSAILGVGTQFIVIIGSILLIGSLNLMNVRHHGVLNTLSVVLYALTSGVAGFVSAYRYRELDGKNWIANVNLTSLLFALPMMLGWCVNNTIFWAYQSTQALPWTTVLIVLCIWVVFGLPLTVIGATLGRSVSSKYSAPCRTRAIPRQMPSLDFCHTQFFYALVGGALPFSAVCVELYYIFSTIWGQESYTLYYIVLIVFVLLGGVVASLSVMLTYSQLKAEDYHWWWASVVTGGSVGVFVFGYGIYFLFYHSNMSGVVQLTEYFVHLLLFCYVLFLSMGTVAHVSSHRFVRFIYASVKND